MRVKGYDLDTSRVILQPASEEAAESGVDVQDKNPNKKSRKRKASALAKKSLRPPTPAKLPDTPKKALDKVTTSTTEEIPEHEVKFTFTGKNGGLIGLSKNLKWSKMV